MASEGEQATASMAKQSSIFRQVQVLPAGQMNNTVDKPEQS